MLVFGKIKASYTSLAYFDVIPCGTRSMYVPVHLTYVPRNSVKIHLKYASFWQKSEVLMPNMVVGKTRAT